MPWFCFILDWIVQVQNIITEDSKEDSYPFLETFSLFPVLFWEDITAFSPWIKSFSLLLNTAPTSISSCLYFYLSFLHLLPLPTHTTTIPSHFLWSHLGYVLSVCRGFHLGIIFILPKAYKPYWSLSFVKRRSEAKITCNIMPYNVSGVSVLFSTVSELSPLYFC